MSVFAGLLGPLVAFALVVGCARTGSRSTPETRYLGALLDARKLGASELARIEKQDPAVQMHVAKNGQPDFILMPTPQDVELIYYQRSVVTYFHRPSPDAASVIGTLTPLPNAVLNNLPSDIRAGTPSRAEAGVTGADCWSVPVAGLECRTCCAGPSSCTGGCPAKR